MRSRSIALVLLLGLASGGAVTGIADAATKTLPDGLQIMDAKLGTGAVASPGKSVTVNYNGWLYENHKKGQKFDSSLDHGTPFTFTLGAHSVIPGWDEGVAGMKVGGTRTLIIPPALGYGAAGTPDGSIPPNATLIFDVQLLAVQ